MMNAAAPSGNDGVAAIGTRHLLSWKFLESSATFRPSIAKVSPSRRPKSSISS